MAVVAGALLLLSGSRSLLMGFGIRPSGTFAWDGLIIGISMLILAGFLFWLASPLSDREIAALLAGPVLLLAGGWFLLIGVGGILEPRFTIPAFIWIAVGGGVSALAVHLFRFAFRRHRV